MSTVTRQTVSVSDSLHQTMGLLEMLNEDELRAIQTVARVFIAQSGGANPFLPKTSAQIEERIDASLKQLEQGQYEDAEDVEKEIAAEYGLV